MFGRLLVDKVIPGLEFVTVSTTGMTTPTPVNASTTMLANIIMNQVCRGLLPFLNKRDFFVCF